MEDESNKVENGQSGGEEEDDNEILPCCCCRFFTECCFPCSCSNYFTVREGKTKILDIQKSFCPNTSFHIICKLLLTGFVVFDSVYSFFIFPWKVLFFGYLTHWALTTAVIYMIVSLINSFFPIKTQPYVRPNTWIRISWVLSELALHAEIVATVLYWGLEYDPSEYGGLTFARVMNHGGVTIIVALDMFLINRVPVRLKHWLYVFLYDLLYFVWIFTHTYANIGHPKEGKDLLF